ncbi:ABC-type nickel/cobalt efflux system, permease component RcnA [Desulfofundulus thermosubterraneus DSM 16057]|uniref:ABC-type nickel/cobalt efflux system, permease component RcnA n=1 Tax=Desulfofundulus thermosubterraneus DSM 16057 TaxID=1121432 RepID=A0A1M6HLR2_9FIRM|nr:ABC-type nickel/cobalt efflux system, permease component RcnA [Desulfofundulus thermosubterraneus DSM 16057]
MSRTAVLKNGTGVICCSVLFSHTGSINGGIFAVGVRGLSFGITYLSAFSLGVLHALEPGHGKGIMGAYLVLSRGRAVDALLLGLITAATHTLVVLVLAMGTRWVTWLTVAAAGVPRQELEVWLQLISGVLIAFIGLRLLFTRGGCCPHCGRPGHLPVGTGVRRDRWGLLLVGVTNGLVPCPGALTVMLLSIGSGTPLVGLSLVVAFGLGGALALVGVGLLFVKLSHLAQNMLGQRSWRWLTVTSGLLIFFTGVLTAWTAF